MKRKKEKTLKVSVTLYESDKEIVKEYGGKIGAKSFSDALQLMISRFGELLESKH